MIRMKYLDYPEQQKHGNQDFPYYFYHVTYIHPRYNMPYHWHPFCEIVHVISGHFRIQMEEREYLLSSGDSAFVNGGVTHGGVPVEESGCQYECMLMDLDAIFMTGSPTKIFDARIGSILNQQIQVGEYFCAADKINRTICSMLELLRSRPDGYTLLLQGNTFLLFGEILQRKLYRYAKEETRPQKPIQLKKVLSYIDEHYSEKIKLEELAACANMNEHYFCRYFYSLTRRTPMEYLNYYRIEVACEQLHYTQKTITEIAYDCGFQDASYFVKVFKRYRKQTPSEYIRAKF